MFKKLFGWLQGRTTAYIIGFFITGHVMAWFHKLDGNFTAFMAALLAAAVGHSWKDDQNAQNMAKMNLNEDGTPLNQSGTQGQIDDPDAGSNNS